ncbi:prolipoprotein diacylglyceryl transferase [Alkaliphilus transvaalensis]|uniref:prolipoprotein diacylglyceryl transferase n=1 Tax=Alkaliphilus transvaalensis TaxID=114628 RepID=UPI0004791A46|nr:prolipoprotein diacylglyceryl transferase [Alkaliphilus transvaalensis]
MKTFHIGGIPIQLFGLTIAIGVMVGLYIVVREAKRKNMNQEDLTDLALYTVIVGIIGARLNYILAFNPSYYLSNPLEILMIQNGGLSIQGSLIAGIIFALWYMNRKKMDIGKTADVFAPAIIMGQAIGRIGCDVFGVEMNRVWPWGVNVAGRLLHPAQIYEAILNYILFMVLWNKRKKLYYNGQLFVIYLIGFSMNRFIVEFFRTNPMVAGPISIAHLYSLGLVAGAIALRWYFQKKDDNPQSNGANATVKIEVRDLKRDNIMVIGMMILSVFIYYFIHR